MENKKDFEKIEMPILLQLQVLYEIVHKLIFTLPKYERYSLGEKIQDAILVSIEFSVIANGANKLEKEKILLRLNAKIELLKIFFRLGLNCKLIESQTYIEVIKRLQEIGRMTQGWIKYSKNMI
jgi:hypothetical protein